ncbi:hypothetical protein SXCC_02552 [Gluconacetobacter sp. SXCC-1]|uniref:Uncharacterized protein n=1 Tax=Komagataeibacter rhaeticus TaxID=215221 RepID=A0A181CAJ8_9PROT|nr:hypothetical protein [Komagataeibacter rhaeticus]ATU72914.1 hypothetical protein CT154_08725 [Komagataeibacter xylinus]EGG76801.1 hypothetical protein SXCC_02552 [Gluconacetobacter sp. SXCC-1]QIP35337.1 hypothetical protein GWK63_07555 [Komagataeibacter rhaeticus]QOC47905.1 hypothetical protein ICJ78_07615 [Komagataeibacter rhaeticus]WPP22715.1 hypothetical protein SCD25_04270 [Komagataeibacter rhaeticus]
MADIATISTAIATALAAALCPDGTASGAVTGRPLIIRRGELTQADQGNAAHTLQQGCDFIGITDLPESWTRLDEPLGRPWRLDSQTPATTSISVSGTTATVSVAGGAVPSGTVGLRVGGLPGVTGTACGLHVAVAGDTAASIAATLAASLPGATAVGASLTVPAGCIVQAINAGTQTARCVARRQSQMFVITAWSALPEARDVLGQAISDALALADWLTDARGSTFRIEARATTNDDTAMNRGLFSRPARYLVTFDTDLTRATPAMLAGGIGMGAGMVAGDVLLSPPSG